MKNKYIYFFFSGIVLAILFEILAPGKFISYSILFASFLMVFSLISKNKIFRKTLIFLSIFELFFTFSMYLMAIFNPRISEIKNRIFRSHYPFLKKSEREIVIIPGDNKDKLFEFSLLTGRKLRKDYSEHDIDGGRIVPSRNNKYEVLVNTYGGSSTYGWKLSSSQTWQNQLQMEVVMLY